MLASGLTIYQSKNNNYTGGTHHEQSERFCDRKRCFEEICWPDGDVVIPDGVTKIYGGAQSGAFYHKRKTLTSVTIPKSVCRIDNWEFHGCYRLKSVMISVGVKSIENGAFSGCTSLITSISVFRYEQVKTITDYFEIVARIQ